MNPRCEGCPNQTLGVASSRGPRPCKILFVGMCPGRQEVEEGVAFVGGSGKMLAAACAIARFNWLDAGAINVSNCEPGHPNGKDLSNEQITACRERFQRELEDSGAEVIVPLGGEALSAVCGFSGTRNTIAAWRGYLVSPEECRPHRVGRSTGDRARLPRGTRVIIPSYHPSFYMHEALEPWAWFVKDIGRAVRATRGELKIWKPQTWDDPLPERAPIIGFDIETVGFTEEIERLGLSWALGPVGPPSPAPQKTS